MDIADKRSAVGWRQSQQRPVSREGRDSCTGFVSGGTGVSLSYSGQGEITAAHQTLGPGQHVTHLRAQFAVGGPVMTSSVGTEEHDSDVAMAGAALRGVDRLQGPQMKQRGSRDAASARRVRLAIEQPGLGVESRQLAAQTGAKGHSAAERCAVAEHLVDDDAHPLRADVGGEDQVAADMREALAAGCLPQAERLADRWRRPIGRAYLQQVVSVERPQRACVTCIELRIFDAVAIPSALRRRGAPRSAILPGTRRSAAGTPKRAPGRPDPACRGTRRWRAKAPVNERWCDCSSW